MKYIIKMSGRLLVFDKVNANGHLFSKDCEIITPKTVPVLQNFERNSLGAVIGSANITKDEKGLACDVKLTNFDPDILHTEFKDQLYIGGLYSQIKSHKENDITVIDSAVLRFVGTTLYPADDECKMIINEKMYL